MKIHYSYSLPLLELNGQHSAAAVWAPLNEPEPGFLFNHSLLLLGHVMDTMYE